MDPRFTTRLSELRSTCRAVLRSVPHHNAYAQLHPNLSPSAWHIGHAHFVEGHWLRSQLLGEGGDLRILEPLYLPEQCPKSERGSRLPEPDELERWCETMSFEADTAWRQTTRRMPRHGMIATGYLMHFLVQHYAQHLEILRMIQQIAAINLHAASSTGTAGLEPSDPKTDWIAMPACQCTAGAFTGEPAPYDNELGAHSVRLAAFEIAEQPVSNAQWLGFMQMGGYDNPAWWSDEGWHWRSSLSIAAPHHWIASDNGWLGAQPDGRCAALPPNAPVYGISHHEATAYATWCDARLPHELEWLTAKQRQLLDGTGQAWEWCANTLYTFPGFRAFPYPGYTLPWCDGRHFVLKGGSRWTEPDIRRDSFRNFYTADMRHIFAGLRLARSATDLSANCADRRRSTE